MLGQHYIYDVWSQPISSTSGWSNTCTYNCGSQTIIGGYGCFGAGAETYKTYTISLAHTSVTIQFDIYFIDSWDGEVLSLLVDGTTRYSQSYALSYGWTYTQYCGVGDTWYDYVTTVTTTTFAHTSSSLKLHFKSTLDQGSTDESWGFKNVKITVWPVCATGCSKCYGNSVSECSSCSNGWYLSGSTCVTDCGPGYWNNPSGNVCSGKLSLILLSNSV